MAQDPRPIPELMAEAQAAQAATELDRAGQLYRQVVRQRPDHAGAWLARIEIALRQGQARRALRQCDAALPLCPGHQTQIQTKRARALEARGQRPAARALLEDLHSAAPGDLPVLAVLAGLRHREGDTGAADRAWAEVLALRPQHAGAWLARIEIALAEGRATEALDMVTRARPHCAAQIDQLDRKQARALAALGRTGQALTLLADLRRRAPADPQLALTEAGLQRRTGDLAGAEAAYLTVLAAEPDHLGAWLGRIDVAQTAGDLDRALALATAALAARPDAPALLARHAGLLAHLGQPDAARTALMAGLEIHPGDLRLRLELARVQMQAGLAAAAAEIYAACLDEDPESDAARLGLAEAEAARGAPEAGLAVLEGHAGRSIALGLKAADLALQTGQGSPLRRTLDQLSAEADRMSEPELLRLFKLGEQADHAPAALAVVGSVSGRARLSPLIAQFLLQRARVILPPDQADRVRQALELRLPGSRQPEFRAFAAALFGGPEAALAQARADLPGPRDTQGAALLGERLLDAGQSALALRYLRFCVRRWPLAPHLRRQFLRATIEAGALERGHGWLDTLETRFPDLDLGLERMQQLTQQGRLEETRALAEAREAAGLKTLSPRQFLDLTLALGDLEKSTVLARRVQTEPGAGRQNAAHFSTTLHGAQFNELRLYHAALAQAEASGDSPAEARRRLAEDFFFPAKQIVADRAADLGPDRGPEDRSQDQPEDRPKDGPRKGPEGQGGPRPGAPDVPRQVLQYWNTPAIPDEVAALMQSWQDAPGFAHTLLDRRGALLFLREHFGTSHVRAFQLANSPAEECDFLRLCWLYKHGGIYADADDKRTGDLNALLAEGPGVIVVREPWGAVANNVLCAPPGHPLIHWALRRAGRSLLARENDGTWFKTGPGLMTRAVASWLASVSAPEARAGLTILPQPRLAAHVQPHVRLSYKTGGQYWNARDRHAPQTLVAALTELGAAEAPRN